MFDLPPLSPELQSELDCIKLMNEKELLAKVPPIMSQDQNEQLGDLNYKAQQDGELSEVEEKMRDELLAIYEKSMLIRSAVLAELHERGYPVNSLIEGKS